MLLQIFYYLPAILGVLFITDPFAGLVYSQMMLSIQLPLSVG